MIANSLRRQRISLLFLIVLAAAALCLCYFIAQPFLTSIVTAAVIAIAIHPQTLVMRRHMSRTGAAFAATLLIVFAVLLPAIWVGSRVAHELTELYSSINQQRAQQGSWSTYLNWLLDSSLRWIARETGVSQQPLENAVRSRLHGLSDAALQSATSVVVNVGTMVVNLVIVLVTLFFFLRDGERFRAKIGSLLPIDPDRYQKLTGIIAESITANIYGIFAVAVAQGLLGLIGYAIAGLPSVTLWAITTALFSMVPLLGTACVWGAGCIYLAVIGSWGKMIFLLAYGLAVISVADNIVRPWVLSGKVQLHPLLILFSLLGGVKLFGFAGLFIGPVVVSIAMALLQMLEAERADWERG